MTSPARRAEQWRDQLERVGSGITFTFDGDEFKIPELPARAWLLAHLDDDPLAIFPGLLPDEDEDTILDAIDDPDDELDAQRCSDLGLELLAAASGWAWWEADRLAHVAIVNWRQLRGETLRRGVDLLALSLADYCSAIYSWRVENATQKERDEFHRWLSDPPIEVAGADPDALPEWAAEAEAQSFLGALGALSGG